MRFVAVRNAALKHLQQFKEHGSLRSDDRIELIPAAVKGETNRLRDEFISVQDADGSQADLDKTDGRVVTSRGPSERESFPRHVDTETIFEGSVNNGTTETHQLEKAWDQTEPYQETFESTRYQEDGISHVSVTIKGDAAGVGGIISMAQFLSPEPGMSWRERSFQSFTGEDPIALYQQGTYEPSITP